MESIRQEAIAVIDEILEKTNIVEKDIVIIGCSSSEIIGNTMGTSKDGETDSVVNELYEVVAPRVAAKGAFLAVQCCEHLNRAVVLDREAAIHYGFDSVNVVPQIHAGGAFAVKHFKNLENPVVVEDIKQKALVGIDIGGVMIGMHIRPVVVPLHLENKQIGMARVSAGRHRPKYIGGQRAVYDPNLM